MLQKQTLPHLSGLQPQRLISHSYCATMARLWLCCVLSSLQGPGWCSGFCLDHCRQLRQRCGEPYSSFYLEIHTYFCVFHWPKKVTRPLLSSTGRGCESFYWEMHFRGGNRNIWYKSNTVYYSNPEQLLLSPDSRYLYFKCMSQL